MIFNSKIFLPSIFLLKQRSLYIVYITTFFFVQLAGAETRDLIDESIKMDGNLAVANHLRKCNLFIRRNMQINKEKGEEELRSAEEWKRLLFKYDRLGDVLWLNDNELQKHRMKRHCRHLYPPMRGFFNDIHHFDYPNNVQSRKATRTKTSQKKWVRN